MSAQNTVLVDNKYNTMKCYRRDVRPSKGVFFLKEFHLLLLTYRYAWTATSGCVESHVMDQGDPAESLLGNDSGKTLSAQSDLSMLSRPKVHGQAAPSSTALPTF